MRALVTGSSGFVGRHMAEHLTKRNYLVTGVDVQRGRDALEYFKDCTDRFDLVVHAAARSPHRAAIDGSPSNFPYNMMLDAAMFDWAIRTKQKHVAYLSSCAVYPLALQTADTLFPVLMEGDVNLLDAREPDSVYGWTKLSGERMARSAQAAGVPVSIFRPFSGYGEDQGEDWPFGAFVARAQRREDPFVIWGDGEQVRDWIHIDDLVRGILSVVSAGYAAPVNLCTGIGTSMRELAELITETAGYKPTFEFHPEKPRGVEYRVGSKALLENLQYKPRITLAEGVRRALKG